MKKFLLIPVLVGATFTSSVFAADHASTYKLSESTCATYSAHLATYLDTVLPVYLDEQVTKSNQKNLEAYKELLDNKSDTETTIKVGAQTVKMNYVMAELMNIGKKSYIAGFIYNPFGYGDMSNHNTEFSYMAYTPENIKIFVMENDDMILFCENLELFVVDSSLSEEDSEAIIKRLNTGIQDMKSTIRKHTLEVNRVKNKKISPILIKNTNMALLKLRYIVQKLHLLGAEG